MPTTDLRFKRVHAAAEAVGGQYVFFSRQIPVEVAGCTWRK